jgi:ribulose kinase
LDGIRERGYPVDEIFSVGGATKNQTLLRIVSEITGVKQRIIKNHLGSHYGIALLTACGTGLVGDTCAIETWIGKMSTEIVSFNASSRERYNILYNHYLQVYKDNADLMHALKRI